MAPKSRKRRQKRDKKCSDDEFYSPEESNSTKVGSSDNDGF